MLWPVAAHHPAQNGMLKGKILLINSAFIWFYGPALIVYENPYYRESMSIFSFFFFTFDNLIPLNIYKDNIFQQLHKLGTSVWDEPQLLNIL